MSQPRKQEEIKRARRDIPAPQRGGRADDGRTHTVHGLTRCKTRRYFRRARNRLPISDSRAQPNRCRLRLFLSRQKGVSECFNQTIITIRFKLIARVSSPHDPCIPEVKRPWSSIASSPSCAFPVHSLPVGQNLPHFPSPSDGPSCRESAS
jgi:hypothetical protein